MEIPMKRKILRITWDIPLDRKAYEEIGKVVSSLLRSKNQGFFP